MGNDIVASCRKWGAEMHKAASAMEELSDGSAGFMQIIDGNRAIAETLLAAAGSIEQAATRAQWVPVSTLPPRDPSFPSHSIDVLMWDGSEVVLGFLIFGDDEHGIEPQWSTPNGWTVGNVTHWMPLPQGPEVSRG